jgi:hypothetical protein
MTDLLRRNSSEQIYSSRKRCNGRPGPSLPKLEAFKDETSDSVIAISIERKMSDECAVAKREVCPAVSVALDREYDSRDSITQSDSPGVLCISRSVASAFGSGLELS